MINKAFQKGTCSKNNDKILLKILQKNHNFYYMIIFLVYISIVNFWFGLKYFGEIAIVYLFIKPESGLLSHLLN